MFIRQSLIEVQIILKSAFKTEILIHCRTFVGLKAVIYHILPTVENGDFQLWYHWTFFMKIFWINKIFQELNLVDSSEKLWL